MNAHIRRPFSIHTHFTAHTRRNCKSCAPHLNHKLYNRLQVFPYWKITFTISWKKPLFWTPGCFYVGIDQRCYLLLIPLLYYYVWWIDWQPVPRDQFVKEQWTLSEKTAIMSQSRMANNLRCVCVWVECVWVEDIMVLPGHSWLVIPKNEPAFHLQGGWNLWRAKPGNSRKKIPSKHTRGQVTARERLN